MRRLDKIVEETSEEVKGISIRVQNLENRQDKSEARLEDVSETTLLKTSELEEELRDLRREQRASNWTKFGTYAAILVGGFILVAMLDRLIKLSLLFFHTPSPEEDALLPR